MVGQMFVGEFVFRKFVFSELSGRESVLFKFVERKCLFGRVVVLKVCIHDGTLSRVFALTVFFERAFVCAIFVFKVRGRVIFLGQLFLAKPIVCGCIGMRILLERVVARCVSEVVGLFGVVVFAGLAVTWQRGIRQVCVPRVGDCGILGFGILSR